MDRLPYMLYIPSYIFPSYSFTLCVCAVCHSYVELVSEIFVSVHAKYVCFDLHPNASLFEEPHHQQPTKSLSLCPSSLLIAIICTFV